MSIDTLATKLFIPPIRPQLVSRPHLWQRLEASSHGILTLVTAPAGFGKTTLVADWIQQQPTPVGWLSLDASDNDLGQFLTYLIAASREGGTAVGKATLALLQSPQRPPMHALLASLINELAHVPSLQIVLDDYHLIQDEAIHQAVSFLLENLPTNLHFILISRNKPPLPLPRWRARGTLQEIKTADLRFTPAEAAEFLTKTMQLTLPEEAISNLESYTEGWITGLQLAALAWQDYDVMLEQFSGRHHYVLDYLVDEVLQQQSDKVRGFLLQTAVLERFCAALCNAILPDDTQDSQDILSHLERTNLFIVPLDGERRWYRYHHLFADFLRARLQQNYTPEQIAALHGKAAVWHQQQGVLPEAIEHALLAESFALAADCITAVADNLWTRGSLGQLRDWLAKLPETLFETHPQAAVYDAWATFFAGQQQPNAQQFFTKAINRLDQAEAQLNINQDFPTLGMLFAARTALASVQHNPQQTVQFGQQALTHLPQESHIWRGVVSISLGMAYRFMGNFPQATESFASAARLSQEGKNLSGALFAYAQWAKMLCQQARLPEAERAYREALSAAANLHGDQLPIAGQIYIGLGELLLEWQRLDEAIPLLERGIVQHEAGGFPIVGSLLNLVGIYQAQGKAADALIAKATQLIADNPHLPPAERTAWMAFQLRRGETTAVSHWIQQEQLDPNQMIPGQEATYLVLARWYISQHQIENALTLLTALDETAAQDGRLGSQIQIHIIQAIAHHTNGQVTKAHDCLRKTLVWAAAPGYKHTFVAEGQPISDLLRSLYQQVKSEADSAVLQTQIAQILQTFQAYNAAKDQPSQPLVEPLSQRELQIVRLIVDGRSNQEIADQLVVALSTVKWHINNIYGKLSVQTRAQAVSRAHDLNLIA